MLKRAAGFDFVGAATAGYKFAWERRSFIARYAFPLFLIKFASFVIITSFGLKVSLLRQGLVLLPAYFAEGWFLAMLIRMYLTPQYLGSDGPRAILAATLLYVLIQLFLSATVGLTVMNRPTLEMQGADVPPPSLGMFVAAMIMLSAMVWAFRLLWFYIPAAMGYPLRAFVEKISGYMTSIYMIGTWFMCVLPPGMILLLFSRLLMSGVAEGATPSPLLHFVLVGTQAIVEIIVAIISTIAITEGIRQILFDPPKNSSKR